MIAAWSRSSRNARRRIGPEHPITSPMSGCGMPQEASIRTVLRIASVGTNLAGMMRFPFYSQSKHGQQQARAAPISGEVDAIQQPALSGLRQVTISVRPEVGSAVPDGCLREALIHLADDP